MRSLSLLPLMAAISSTTTAQEDTVSVLQRQLKASASASIYNSHVYATGDVEYDEYQQAWRYLGFFIDCEDDSRWSKYANGGNQYNNNNNNNNNNQHRNLGSHDEGTYEGCVRYVLWAAYVDENYQGQGIGEYQYYDRTTGKWDTTSCKVTENSRCAKMDCHLENTDFTLLGIFKHREPDDWMEQLFKHEGMCVWTEEEYDFMQGARKAWPEGCTMSNSKTESGDYIYYAIKPLPEGDITLGLYSDSKCVEEYTGKSVEDVVGNFIANNEGSHDGGGDYSGYTLEESQYTWDSAFDIFKQCQPCVAHDLNNWAYNGQYGSSWGSYSNDDYNGNRRLSGDVNDNFSCYDDADYTNVNQCMKFAAKTSMDTASFRDVILAHSQGTLVNQLPVNGLPSMTKETKFQSAKKAVAKVGSIIYLVVSLMVLLVGTLAYRRAKKVSGNTENGVSLREPLGEYS